MNRTGLLDVWRASHGAIGGRRRYLVALAILLGVVAWIGC